MTIGRLLLVLIVAATATPGAIPLRRDVEMVPLARVIANVTRTANDAPDRADLQWALGRLHVMAAAQPEGTIGVEVKTGRPPNLRAYGTSSAVPVVPPRSRAATRHLAQAVAHYRRAVELAPGDNYILLGLAWSLDYAGQTSEAVSGYRTVIRRAWEADRQRTVVMAPPRTAEAIGYLLPHLDPTRDAEEIRTLEARRKMLAELPRAVTPIVVSLDEEAAPGDLVDRSARVPFDLDGTGRRDAWEWITPRAAWLVWDPADSARIDSALQLFGSVTFWVFWPDGYHALASLDDDADGWLHGRELHGLALWRDRNGDGRSERSEVVPVSVAGIEAIAARAAPGETEDVAAYAPVGVRYADGRTARTFDLVLHRTMPFSTRK